MTACGGAWLKPPFLAGGKTPFTTAGRGKVWFTCGDAHAGGTDPGTKKTKLGEKKRTQGETTWRPAGNPKQPSWTSMGDIKPSGGPRRWGAVLCLRTNTGRGVVSKLAWASPKCKNNSNCNLQPKTTVWIKTDQKAN